MNPTLSALSALSALAVCTAAVPAMAQEAPFNLFISPAGQPFTAPKGDPYPIVAWFKGADKNNDGKLDKLEHRADAEAFFAVLDRDKNGVVAGIEVQIYEHLIVPEILQVGEGPAILIRANYQDIPYPDMGGSGGGSVQPPRQRLNSTEGAVFFSLFKEPEPVRAADRNLDYKVTLQEYRDQADRHFAVLDVNGDGFLTLDELPQTPAERQAKARRVPR